MSQVTIAFHPSVELTSAAKGVVGASISIDTSWSVRQLSAAIERHCLHNRAGGVRIGALINPARGCAAPPHEQASSHFKSGDKVVILADVQENPWPTVEAAIKPRVATDPVPITIFTGFLGAGKTTVLNHLLLHQRDKRFAVVENEFGAVPIDNELLQNQALGMAEQVVVMENGCMCCTIRGDLLGAFDSIRMQMEKGSPLDAVLVETTGMADPVPIVRTLRQTPAIAKYFKLDGTITLVDSKTILDRLGECAEATQEQERHRQISFADKILLNKIDLVNDTDVAKVWASIRSYNSTAPIISCVKGIVPGSELTNLGAFDVATIAAEQKEHGHGQGHGHGHECDDDCDHGHGNGHGHGHECDDDCHEDHGSGKGHAHGHERSTRHDAEIGSFSIVRKGVEIETLAFARWIRVIATLPEEKGKLYRSKGVLAVAGRSAKLIFHAVADVTETQDGPEWDPHEQRICKMVFIGKQLARKEIEARFLEVLQPATLTLRPPLTAPTPSRLRRPSLVTLAATGALQRALVGVWTKDVITFSQTCPELRDAVSSPQAFAHFQRAGASIPQGQPRGLQTIEGNMWLHGLLPMVSIREYALTWKKAKIKVNTPCSGDYMWGEPLRFDTAADVEASGVMALEICELQDADVLNYVIEFRWRPDTMKSFFAHSGSATNSALVKVCVEDPEDSDNDDELKFRVNLNPEAGEESSGMQLHRLSLQLVGGKSSSHIYQIFFHTIDPTYQVHINVPDHRMPIFPTKEVFHQWHPLMNGLKERPRLRFLTRLKPMESGPLDAMCGCCG